MAVDLLQETMEELYVLQNIYNNMDVQHIHAHIRRVRASFLWYTYSMYGGKVNKSQCCKVYCGKGDILKILTSKTAKYKCSDNVFCKNLGPKRLSPTNDFRSIH